jgi:5-formyltetrahydrofolate cyclo-ligase
VIDKKTIRVELRKSRNLFEKNHFFWPSNLKDLPAPLLRMIGAARVVAGYAKAGSEVDATCLIALAAGLGRTTALPWLSDRIAPLVFREWAPGEALEAAPFGFRQPLATAQRCTPDLIFTPLLGFDRAMNRLGQGAGHYDRAFASNPDSLRIGLAWSVQECPDLSTDPWDVPLDAVLTEKEWITGAQSRIKPR